MSIKQDVMTKITANPKLAVFVRDYVARSDSLGVSMVIEPVIRPMDCLVSIICDNGKIQAPLSDFVYPQTPRVLFKRMPEIISSAIMEVRLTIKDDHQEIMERDRIYGAIETFNS